MTSTGSDFGSRHSFRSACHSHKPLRTPVPLLPIEVIIGWSAFRRPELSQAQKGSEHVPFCGCVSSRAVTLRTMLLLREVSEALAYCGTPLTHRTTHTHRDKKEHRA